MTSAPERRLAVLLLLGASCLFSTAGFLIKLLPLPALVVAGGRSAFAALFILACIRRPKFTWSKAQLGGAVMYCAMVVFFVLANKTTTAANAILLQYTAPMYIALLGSWLLHERPTRADWGTIGFVLIGMMLFLLDGLSVGNWLGNIVALLCAFCYAVLTILLRKQKDASPYESVLLGNILTALVSIPALFAARPSLQNWLVLALMGMFQLGLAWVLVAKATRHVTAMEIVLIGAIEPILNPLWVVLIVGERPSFLAMIGGVIVMGAVVARGIISTRAAAVRLT
ncbi:MAG TPA: DMT family transporter [Blastocatellia bacterium]|nr:DMT family transporter [Blastocatellia bacterium]